MHTDLLNTAAARFTRLTAVMARTNPATTPDAGERANAYRVARGMLTRDADLLGAQLRAVVDELPRLSGEAFAQVAVTLYLGTADASAVDRLAVNTITDRYVTQASVAELKAAESALRAMRKPVKGVYTGDHLREITVALWPIERELRARAEAAPQRAAA